MTPKQEMAIRDFYSEVLTDESLFANDAGATRKAATQCCLTLLGYVIYRGAHCYPEDIPSVTFGQQIDVPDRWAMDTQACMEALNETDSGEDTDEADNSVEAEDSEEVREEAVLSEDV